MRRHLALLAALIACVPAMRPGMAAAAPPIEVTGQLEVVQIDDFTGPDSRLVHKLRARSGRRFEVEFAGTPPSGLRTGMQVRLRGHERRGKGGRRVLAVGAEPSGVEVLAEAAAAVTGARRAVVLVVDFLVDGKTVACSDAAIASEMFSGNPSVDRLYQETSFGQLSFPADTDGNGAPDVFRVHINQAGSGCADASWRSAADSAATTAGVNLGLYQHRLYVLPSSVGCTWAGLGQVGCGSACWSMVATCDRGDVYAHELGHNLGMYHASFDADDNGAVDGTCPWGAWPGGGEYCDDSDFMGISTDVWRQTNGPHKHQMGWLPADRIVDVTASGTYTIAPLETSPTDTALPLVLRVARPQGSFYYLSYRRRVGYDASMHASYADRTNVHAFSGGNTLLVRYLADGESFDDPTGNVHVTQAAHDATAAAIVVSMTCGNGVVDAGEECDGAALGGASCGGCAGTPACTTGCRLDYASCTNGVCEASETCSSCAADCVGAGAVCGDGVCQAGDGESCVTCPADCNGRQSGRPNGRFCCGFAGQNPVGCSPSQCGSCTTGATPVCCGDGVCTGDETTVTCLRDCPPCTDADGDGYCATQGDCNDANPAVRPGAPEACTGGTDDDCDGLIDCADPTCGSSPSCAPTCQQAGTACTVASQCCSLNCSGKKNQKTCR